MLSHKIDFAIVITAQNCNPNGDPLNGNVPRQNFEGYGEMSDVCLKRKIRNRMQDMGHNIFMQSAERVDDGARSMLDRIQQYTEFYDMLKVKDADISTCMSMACEKWIDVRTFGQIFPLKKSDNASFSVRGPVTINIAKSVDIVLVKDIQITKALNLYTTANDVKDPSTMAGKYVIEKGAYVAYGSMFPYLADKTGFSDADAEVVHEALITLLENDASAARPSGSMSVSRVYWWEHNSKIGQYSSGKVFRTLKFSPKNEYPFYEVTESHLEGLVPEIYSEFD